MRFGRRATWAGLGLALGLVCGGVAVLAIPPTTPPDFMGHPVTAPGIVGGPTFEVRHNCRIGRFGVAPWLNPGRPKDARWEQMTRLWLSSIGMPAAGHDGAIAALRSPARETTTIQNTSGPFDTTYRVGDRYVSCLQSQTRFASDWQTEPADLHPYEFGGRVWQLAIIQRCGNVTQLPSAVVPPPAAAYGPGGGGYSPAPFPLPGGPVHEVPEPGTLGLMLAALGALLVWRKK